MWFEPGSIALGANPAAYAKGLQLYRAQRVLALDVLRGPGPAGQNWTLQGHVQGSLRSPYQLVIELRLAPDRQRLSQWVSLCSCPVGSQCKHGVALMLKAAYLRVGPEGHPSGQQAQADWPTPEQRAQSMVERLRLEQLEAERQRADQLRLQAERWLQGAQPLPAAAAGNWAAGRALPSPIYLLRLVNQPSGPPKLHLILGAASPKANGGWSKPRRVGTGHFLNTDPREVKLSEADRDALALIGALPPQAGGNYYSLPQEWALDTVAAAQVLALAGGTGRLFWREDNDHLGHALQWGDEQVVSWSWQEQVGSESVGPLWSLRAGLPGERAQVCANRPLLYLDLAARCCGPVQGGASEQLQALLQAPPLPEQLLREHEAGLLRRLGGVTGPPPVLPTLRHVGGEPLWRLHLSRLDDTGLVDNAPPQALCAQLDFDYEGCQGWWPDAESPVVLERDDGERVWVVRDLASEARALERLQRQGLMLWTEGMFVLPPGGPQSLWLFWAEQRFQPLRDQGFLVSTDADLSDWVSAGGELAVALTPQGRDGPQDTDAGHTADWFDLSLGLEVNGQRINLLPWLPQIIAELRQAERAPEPVWPEHLYLPEAGGRGFMRVHTEPLKPWLNALLELFDDRATDFGADTLRLSRIDALRARVALGEGVAWEGAKGLGELAQRLQGRAALPATPLPRGLNAQLRPYQHHGLDWLQFLREAGLAGILADDMGLGKTLQALAHIQCEKEAGRLDRPALVIAPVSLLGNWRREAERFCPELRTLILHGAERHEQAEDMAQAELVIAPYSLLHRDRERWLGQPWHLVVLDEAHHIKNAATQAFQVVTELNTRHRLCLTGTPIENHLGELWSLFHCLMPGFLGSQARYTQRFRTPIEKHGDGQRMAALRARVTPFILRRHKQDVATELPPKVVSVMPVELSGKQADLYETIRLAMEASVRQAMAEKGLAKSQIAVLDALLKLRQVCCDPRLVKTAAAAKVKTSAKLEQLMELLPEMLAEGRRILLFSAFTSMLSLIEDELKKRDLKWVKLTGQTQKRDDVIARFTSGEVPLFLISLKAGGVGLNLPQADTVIHYDPWWNPAAENQATDRAHRIGQTQSVWVVKLVAQGTIEERILALQERKAELARELYSGAAARKQPLFTEDDVRALLRPLG